MINWEFISDIRVNSHSPILEMSLKDVSVILVRQDLEWDRNGIYPNNAGPRLVSFECAGGTLPSCKPDRERLLERELGWCVGSRFSGRSVVHRPELSPKPAVLYREVSPFWIALSVLALPDVKG
jgi:hypothetical protein